MLNKTNSHKDFIIVGQGIAGTLLALNLLASGKSVLVIDAAMPYTASKISSGVINPITGRKYVLSWKFEDLLEELQSQYQNFEAKTGETYLKEKTIIRTLSNPKEENYWYSRGEAECKYCEEEGQAYEYEGRTKNVLNYAEISGWRFDAKKFVNGASSYLVSKDALHIGHFDFDQLDFEEGSVSYKNVQSSKIVFCEGWHVKDNPLFNYLPFKPAKGEVLIIKILDISPQVLIKHGLFCIPLDNDLYWLGSTYEWDDLDELTTPLMKEKIIRKFEEHFDFRYEVVDQLAGVRPSTHVRRPFLGQHPTHKNAFIFNGLGTKGCSLGPFFAKQMCQYMVDGKPVEDDVSIRKYDSLFQPKL